MSDPCLLPVRPGTLDRKTKASLAAAGVIVVECANPAELRLLRPTAELSTSDMLIAAVRGVMDDNSDRARKRFAVEISNMLEAAYKERRKPDHA